MDKITSKGDIELFEIEDSSDLNQFIKLPFKIYKDDPNWVAPLISERKTFFDTQKNPFYKSAKTRKFIARKKGEYIGRIAICVNYGYNEFHEDKTGFFGFFDCIEDYEVAELLFKVAMIKLKAEGMETMLGPVSFSTNHEVGMLIEGYDLPPTVMMTYNKPYYNDFAEKFGLRKAKDLLAFIITSKDVFDPRIAHIAERLGQRKGINLRGIRMNEYDEEIKRVREVYNKAWSKNWGFVPLSEEEFYYIAKDMKQIIDPDLALIAEIEDKPVGFCISLPDINQALIKIRGKLFPFGLAKLLWHTKIKNKIDTLRIITMGLIPKYQKRGIDNLFYQKTLEVGVKKGYRAGEMSWILEDNFGMVSAAENMGARIYKKYRVYGMQL